MGWIKGTLKIQINYKKERSFVILEIIIILFNWVQSSITFVKESFIFLEKFSSPIIDILEVDIDQRCTVLHHPPTKLWDGASYCSIRSHQNYPLSW